MPNDPLLILDLIYRTCRERSLLLPQITRLTKLMYLAEVEYFRRKRERLTGLDWIFYLFGPYPPALTKVLGEPEIETNEWRSGKTSKHVVRDEEVYMRAKAVPDIELVVTSVVRSWGDTDLNVLLDYVYFETEPMMAASRGDLLNFSTIDTVPAKKVQISLDRAKLAELSKRVSDRARLYAELRQPSESGTELADNLRIWDDEENTRFPVGPCRIDFDDLAPK